MVPSLEIVLTLNLEFMTKFPLQKKNLFVAHCTEHCLPLHSADCPPRLHVSIKEPLQSKLVIGSGRYGAGALGSNIQNKLSWPFRKLTVSTILGKVSIFWNF